ncbi:MAG: lipopolysaccharide heptosyltransferase II [Chloroflexi bacterium]|nr:lipopolysaccharide heptosyltransferase II [Chloroflexota bacterium]
MTLKSLAPRRPVWTVGGVRGALGDRPRILILKPCCIGDLLLATPVFRALRQAWPEAHLALGVGRWSRPAVEGNPHLDELVDTGNVGSGRYPLREYLALVGRLRGGGFDACLVLERSLWLALLPALAGIPLRAGFDSAGRGFAHHIRVDLDAPRHETDRYLDVVCALGLPDDGPAPEFHPSDADRAAAQQLFADLGLPVGRAIAINPGGGANPGMLLERKRWPAERFAALIERIRTDGAEAFLVGGPSDHQPVTAVQMALGRPVPSLAGRLTIGQTGAALQLAAAYVGNDTGITHLAAAVGTPVVALYGPSDPRMYRPRADRVAVLQGTVPCGPCFVDGAVSPCARYLCMERIEVGAVWDALCQLLATISADS